jgi:hypothetical protein
MQDGWRLWTMAPQLLQFMLHMKKELMCMFGWMKQDLETKVPA